MSPSIRRLSALALALVLAGGLMLLVLSPLAWLAAWHEDEFADTQKALVRFRAVAAGRERAEAELRSLRQAAASFPGLFQGPTSAIASANMQAEIKRQLESEGGELRSLQPSAVTVEGELEKLEVKVDFTCAPHALPALLAKIEAAQPFLFIRQVTIGSPEFQQQGQTGQPVKLSNQWIIRGYGWAGGR